MGVHGGPDIVEDGLIFAVDAGNDQSYVSGSLDTFSLVSLNTGSIHNDVTFNSANQGSWVFDGTDDNIVCGDAYIITGQSNSHASSNKSIYSSPFIRSFGVKTGYEKYSDEDKKIRWGLATGNCKNCKGEAWEKGYDGGWFVKISHNKPFSNKS